MTLRLNRRRFVRVAGSSALASLVWTYAVEPGWLSIESHELKIDGLPSVWSGKSIAQVSDLHVGAASEGLLRFAFRCLAAINPDMVIVTGDFINHDFVDIDVCLGRVLSELKALGRPVFGCLGNHDYGRHWSQLGVADRVSECARENGVRILRNQREQIAGLTIVGIDDYWTPRFDAAKAASLFEKDTPALCLCHNPDVCDQPIWKDFSGIVFSGHTHGGQCKPPFLPPPRTPVDNKRYTSGFFQLDVGRTLYINRGIGYTKRLRFNCRPEITVFTLRSANTTG